MKIITKQDRILGVSEAWRKQHPVGCKESFEIKYKKLKALRNLTEKTIALIIGNRSWTRLECTECRLDSDIIIQFDDVPNYETSTVWICLQCLEKAKNRIRDKTFLRLHMYQR